MDKTQELEFPCDYPIKVICNNEPDLKDVIGGIVSDHTQGFDPSTIVVQPSKNGTFISLRIKFTATSREQLDAMHQAIIATGRVKMVL